MLSRRAEETRRGRTDIRAINPLLMQNFPAFGVEVFELTDAQRQAMADATRDVHQMFRDRVDGGSHLLDLVLADR